MFIKLEAQTRAPADPTNQGCSGNLAPEKLGNVALGVPQSFQMRARRLQNHSLEASGGPLGANPAPKAGLERFWGGSWRLLGLSWGGLGALQGRSWRILGPFGGSWGRSGGHLGSFLGTYWRHEQDIVKTLIFVDSTFLLYFPGPGDRKSVKNHAKIVPRASGAPSWP